MTVAALSVAALLFGQDALSKFNGTWKSENGKQIRKLTVKGGVIYMEEDNSGRKLQRQYPTNGELTMPDDYGVWAKAHAVGKMEGPNKVVVDTTTETFGNWHDEWTMSEDGKTYLALRVPTGGNRTGGGPGGPGGGKGPGGGGPGGPGAAKGPAGPPMPETFTRIE